MFIFRFLYTDHTELTTDNVAAVRYAAKKYCVDSLSTFCIQFLEKNITPFNACVVMEKAHCFADEDIFQSCLKYIGERTIACLNTTPFLSVCQYCLSCITVSDELTIKESDLFQQIVEWSKSECLREELENTESNTRKVLGDVIFNIRFPLMSIGYFSKYIEKTNILKEIEREEMRNFFNSRDEKCLQLFTSKRRRGPMNVCRFSSMCSFKGRTAAVYSLYFKVSKTCTLYGIVHYPSINDDCILDSDVEVKLRNIQNEEIMKYHIELRNPTTKEGMLETYFSEAKNLNAQEVYKMELSTSVPPSICGNPRLMEVSLGRGNVVYFMETTSTRDGYEVYEEHGQIPGLILMWNHNDI